MTGDYVVALFTHGSFHGWATDPITYEEAVAFISDPPEVWAPRPQDTLVAFNLTEMDS